MNMVRGDLTGKQGSQWAGAKILGWKVVRIEYVRRTWQMLCSGLLP